MRVVVVTPTFNELGNIDWFVESVRASTPDAHIMVVDDNSPDGTGRRADELAAADGNMSVVHRAAKVGLGSAYRDAFQRVLADGFEVIVSMDCDRSHSPSVIPALLAEVDRGSDLVIGSRYVDGGATPNWPVHRRLLSRWGNRYAAAVLGLRVRDATSGFRAYRAASLATADPSSTVAEGYAFLCELVRRFHRRRARISEVPIVFVDRVHGTSKMSGRVIVESMVLVTSWALRDRLRPRQPVE